jgi:hypothetical protein
MATFAMTAASLLWRLLSEQKTRHWERFIYIAASYTVTYVTGMILLRKLLERLGE